jgi:prepilin-type N-terminal cleavage/methylation domain-containing protein
MKQTNKYPRASRLAPRSGFTLIEILIVVAIIAILASVVLVGLGPTQQAGRDARRLSDLHEVQNGLELYNSKCGYYPGEFSGGVCQTAATQGYGDMATTLTSAGIGVTAIPLDPTNTGNYKYLYLTNGASADTYILAANLENANDSVFVSYTPPTSIADPSGDTLTNNCNKPEYCISL